MALDKKVNLTTVIDNNVSTQIDRIKKQYTTLKKLKNQGALYVLKKEIELLNMWLDDIK